MKTRHHPHLFQVNARLWLTRLSGHEGRRLTLATIPEQYLKAIAARFDLLWLMGAWRRSPQARERALTAQQNIGAYDAALPGWSASDVEGSPYAIYGYELDPELGAPEELAVFRNRLHQVGVGLVVDFVVNHLALDHPWTLDHPDWFIRLPEQHASGRPDQFFRTSRGDWLAHGRDPNFPPWTDTAQVNLFCLEARSALIQQISAIAALADGVRADMAMLGLSQVFEQVWGWALSDVPRPQQELWSEVIERAKAVEPDFLFIAEAYWGLENKLFELGFDHAYDKRLYDLLLSGSAFEIRQHLTTGGPLLNRGVRFIENHDELRAVTAFGRERSMSAALATMTLPGLRLVHDGQEEGKRVRLPVQLVREPLERVDADMSRFYEALLAATNRPAFHDGVFQLLDVGATHAWDESYRNILAWTWTHDGHRHLIALNQSGAPANGRLHPPPGIQWPATPWKDELDASHRVVANAVAGGLDVHLEPWCAALLENAA
jgi:hypothetical protein